MSELKRKITISTVSALVLCLIFYALVFSEKIATIKSLNKEHNNLNRALKQAEQTISGYRRLRVKLDSIIPRWKELEDKLPEKEEMPKLLREIANAGKLSKVDFTLFKPLPTTAQEFYTENPIEIRVRCGYHQLGRFLSRVAMLSRLVNVKDLQILAYSSENSTYTVEASFTAIAYTVNKERKTVEEKKND